MQVFLVTTDQEFPYDILGAFTEAQEAQRIANLVEDAEIVELTVGHHGLVDPGRDYFRVLMLQDGSLIGESPKKLPRLDDSGQHRGAPRAILETKDSFRLYAPLYDWCLRWEGYADSGGKAIQACNDLRKRILVGDHPPELRRY